MEPFNIVDKSSDGAAKFQPVTDVTGFLVIPLTRARSVDKAK
jgi:hypothetical protein